MAEMGFWEGLAHDLAGKGQFRLYLQPAMAIILGVRLGIADAREGQTPFVLRLLTGKGRGSLLKQSIRDALVPLIIALSMDAFLQLITWGRLRPLQAVVVGALLVWIPFVVSRALTNRAWRARQRVTPA